MRAGGRPVRTPAATILRLEGAVLFLAALAAYVGVDGSWVRFLVFFLAPDLLMLGYLKGPVVGARLYNAGHTYLAPAVLLLLWWFTPRPLILEVVLIWSAHIALDRALGFGLKDPTGFRDTHLQRT